MFAASTWIHANVYQQFLASCDATDIGIAAARSALRESWAKLARTKPFDHNKRFPDYEVYVCIDAGDWPRKISQMLSALSYKEPDNKGKNSVSDKTGSKVGGNNSTNQEESKEAEVKGFLPGDVLLSFQNAVARMRDQINRGDGVYDRRSLETEMNLKWETDKTGEEEE